MSAENKDSSAPETEKKPLSLITPDTRADFETGGGFELMQRVAKMFSASKLIPSIYQGDVANCAIAFNIAQRIGADPLMVMQNLYIVNGKPGWSAAFLIATFNTGRRFSSLRFEYSGERDTDGWSCRAWAIDRETGDKVFGTTITMKMARAEGWFDKNGSKWKTMPEQMLAYRAASFFIRTNAPEISLGLQTVEELDDAFNTVVNPDGTFVVVPNVRPGDHDPAPGRTASAAAAAAAAPVLSEEDKTNREKVVASLAVAAAKGLEDLEMSWAFLDEPQRLLVGAGELDRLKKLAGEKPKA